MYITKVTYLIHGFNVHDCGADTVAKLRPYLTDTSGDPQGCADVQVVNWAYGWIGLLGVLFKNKKIAKRFAHRSMVQHSIKLPVYAVGHSNGAAILVEAARQGVHFEHLLLINPALKVDTIFPASIEKVTVIHTAHDIPTRAASIADRIPFLQLLIPNAWGAMGAKGARLGDKRVTNIDLTPSLEGHSDIFTDANLERYGPFINKLMYK